MTPMTGRYLLPINDLPAGDPLPAAYDWIKTQPEFTGAIDI